MHNPINEKLKGNTKIPRWVFEAIENPSPPGGRHSQAVPIAGSLKNSGVQVKDVFAVLRSMYGEDFPDEEIEQILRWVAEQEDERSSNVERRKLPKPSVSPPNTPEKTSPEDIVGKLLDGYNCSERDVILASPVDLPECSDGDFGLAAEHLYNAGELLNLVLTYDTDTDASGKRKARPQGRGETLTREGWLDRIETKEIEASGAGGWMRINPLDGMGISDRNVTAFRYMLFESDVVAMDLQLALIVKKLPSVAAIIDSGGRSLHAWMRVDCDSQEHYRRVMGQIDWEVLSRSLGVDRANRNPSRLSRLPGAWRIVGAREKGGVGQDLLYLNPDPHPEKTISQLHSL